MRSNWRRAWKWNHEYSYHKLRSASPRITSAAALRGEDKERLAGTWLAFIQFVQGVIIPLCARRTPRHSVAALDDGWRTSGVQIFLRRFGRRRVASEGEDSTDSDRVAAPPGVHSLIAIPVLESWGYPVQSLVSTSADTLPDCRDTVARRGCYGSGFSHWETPQIQFLLSPIDKKKKKRKNPVIWFGYESKATKQEKKK